LETGKPDLLLFVEFLAERNTIFVWVNSNFNEVTCALMLL